MRLFVLMFAVSCISTFAFVYVKAVHPKNYYLIDYIHSERCDIINDKGELIGTFPLGYCVFQNDKTVVGGLQHLQRKDISGNILWSKDLLVDHHMHVEPRTNSIWALHYEFYNELGKRIGSGVISEFDQNGKLIFEWKVRDHLGEMIDKFKNLHLSTHPEIGPNRIRNSYIRMSGIHIIGENDYAKQFPYLKPGNILLSCWETLQMFIVDKETSKIVWNTPMQDFGILAPHTPFVRKDGKIVFFINNFTLNRIPGSLSGVGVLDVKTNQIEKYEIPTPFEDVKFTSNFQGSIYPDGDGYIALATLARLIVRLRSDFTVDWIKHDIFTKQQPYRARPIEAGLVEPFLKQVN